MSDYADTVSPDGVLIGCYHQCPLCFRVLKHNRMPGLGETYWYCPECGWWDTAELIKYMMMDEDA